MKRYDKQKVMKDAHRIYNSVFQRRGRTWAQCLKAAWSWERDAVKTRVEKAVKFNTMIAVSQATHNVRKNKKTNINKFEGLSSDTIAWAMGYGRNCYCGD